MNRLILLVAAAFATLASSDAAQAPVGWRSREARKFTVSADRIAADNIARTAVLTGNVTAVSEPVHLHSEFACRDTNGVMRLCDPTTITTCTNHPGICHWSLRGEVSYLDGKYIEGRNVWFEFYELPVFWLPYFYYPLEGECGLRAMPGYNSRWGAYLLTKYVYEIAGDAQHRDNTWWLHGNTRFDLRYENGIGLGETLYWNLGDFGRGKFKLYYAWDEDYDQYQPGRRSNGRDWSNWGSDVERDRYAFELSHRWEVSERDTVRVRGYVVSDSHFQDDFFREGTFTIRNEWMSHSGNELAWEHAENAYGAGVSASGPLNNFYGGTMRLPEVYFDVQPMPLLSSPVNYETENRVGYLRRQAAEYGGGARDNPYAHNPGLWADCEAFRFDTYHRLTAPFRTMDDILSVVPRVAYRGTWWSETGEDDLTGWQEARNAGAAFRSIAEGGVTLATRGKAWIDDVWQHTVEPYADVLAQKAWYSGVGDGTRPYVFDSLDVSRMWEDQFAGRARNLPYTYYGVTPGVRNSFGALNERGRLEQMLDLDVYAAAQFNGADFLGDDDRHKLAELGSPNYGRHGAYLMPGARARWTPADDLALMARFEYDPDNNNLAFGDIGFRQTVSKTFSYYANYSLRDFRWWDFSSSPYDPSRMSDDNFNWTHFHTATVGFTQQPIDWFAWSPFIRWDLRNGELDSVGSWFDYLTDCLGFRLQVQYTNEYTWLDGYRRDSEWDVGFYVYLRALGAEGANLFD